MPGFRGRALYYPALLIGAWVAGRSLILSAQPAEIMLPEPLQRGGTYPSLVYSAPATLCPLWPAINDTQPQTGIVQRVHPTPLTDRTAYLARHADARTAHSRLGLSDIEFDLLEIAMPPVSPRTTAAASASHFSPDGIRPRRLQVYGYSFYRQGSGSAVLGPGAQYGGSQAGLIATWDPFGKAGKGPALLLRGSATPDGLERELALGTRWKPAARWPVSLSVERRFRIGAADSFAAYAAGGVNDRPIFGKLRLNAYAQTGFDSGNGGSGFYDAQARLMHPLINLAGIPVRVGAGSWAGGQRGVHRLDIGPTISTRIENRFADLTFQLDWRKRVAGNAQPKDGLALTVSTGF